MATIKTQLVSGQPRIITKLVGGERRVSCSCCEEPEGCCMYPADQLGIGYTSDDLPDTLRITNIVNSSPITIEASKSGSSYPFTFDYPSGGSINLTLFASDGSWQFDPPVDEWGVWVQPCLIAEEGTVNVEDNFADTYTLDALEQVLLTRESLCVWSGIGPSGCDYQLVYDDRGGGYWGGNPSPYKWTVQNIGIPFCGEGAIVTKLGSQNTPVGDYEEDVIVSET